MRRKLPAEYGHLRVYVSPEGGGLRYWRRDLRRVDPTLFSFVDEFVQAGMSLWDIGANMGLAAFPALWRVGACGFVLAVEPDPENVALLLKSRRAVPRPLRDRLSVLCCAAGDRASTIGRLAIAARSRSANALDGMGTTQMGGVRERLSVPVVPLDELVAHFPPPDVVKIDVEGGECRVLAGARMLLGDIRPVVHVEVSEQNRRAAGALLRGLGYRLYSADELGDRSEHSLPPWNCLALPSAGSGPARATVSRGPEAGPSRAE